MADTWRVNGAMETVEVTRPGDLHAAREAAFEAIERWQAGEAADARGLLGCHPQLRRDKSLVLDLACEEFWQRKATGEQLDPEDFSRGFPEYQASLVRALQVQHYLEENPLPKIDETPWPELGTEFLGFPLQEELGRGAFAQVYLATEPQLANRMVALKVSPQGMQEAERLGKLAHPNIVPVYRVEQDPRTGLTAVCMPYLGRATLADVLDAAFSQPGWPSEARVILDAARARYAPRGADAESPDPWLVRGTYADGVLRLGEQLAAALEYTHQRGIYHLDLKPSNVLLTPYGRPMLLDFNLALERDAKATRMGGTLPYMSPEQIRASVLGDGAADVDHRSDVFSLGVILYELLCGSLPFGSLPWKPSPRLVGEHLLAQQQRGPRPLTDRYPLVDASLARLIERCVAFDPRGRPQTAADLAAALSSHLGRVSRTRRWMRSNRRLVYTALLLTAGAAGALGGYARSLDPYWVRMYRKAEATYERGDYDKAVHYLNLTLKERPAELDVLTLRGEAYQEAGHYSLAAKDFAEALRQRSDPKLFGRLGYCLSMAREYEPAIIAYKQAITSGFENERIWSNLGTCYERRQQLDKAEHAFTQAIERNREFGLGYFGRAMVDAHRAIRDLNCQPTTGVADVKRAMALNRPSAFLLKTAAILYAASARTNTEHVSEAITYLEQAVRLGYNVNNDKPAFWALEKHPRFRVLCDSSRSNRLPPMDWILNPVDAE